MAPGTSTVPLDTLLEQRDWVRRLARSVARDDAEADDLEQSAWAVAIERPPRHANSLQAWFGRVVRRLASNKRRETHRRTVREQAAARLEATPAAVDVVAEMEAHRRLVAAVLALEEPYRSTVLLRFFRDLPPCDLARATDVPVGTVRTRLKRATALLREELAGAGGRGAWLGALAPIFGPNHVTSAVSSKTTIASITGGTVMTGKATLAVATLLALAAGYGGGRLADGDKSPPAGGDLAARVEALEAARTPSDGSLAATALQGARETERPAAAAPPSPGEGGLARRVEALESDLASARKVNAALLAWAAGQAPPPRDVDAEKARWQVLTNDELLAEIRRLAKLQSKSPEERTLIQARTLDAATVFLGRNTDDASRAEVFSAQGFVWVARGDADSAETAFHEAARLAGPATPTGTAAGFQLAVVASLRKDNRKASSMLVDLARRDGLRVADRVSMRYIAATYLALEDAVQAQRDLRALLDEFGGSDDPGVRHWVDLAKADIARLEGAGMGGR